MIIDHILTMFTPEVHNSDAMRALVALNLTFSEQLQAVEFFPNSMPKYVNQ